MSPPARRARATKATPAGAAAAAQPSTPDQPAVGGRVVQENPAREQQRAPEPDVQFGTRLAAGYPTVEVEVAVNHERLKRGERGQVPLTPRIQSRIDKGYLRLLTPVPPPQV